MADQYAPRVGSSVATGASAWVPAAPAAAYVATGPAPPADPPAPPPAAVANRQPAAPPAPAPADPASLVRPEAAEPAAAPQPTALSSADVAKGRQLFVDWSCGACHALADAGATGGVGPGLDRNTNLARDYVIATIHDGRGPMPSFGGQISDPDIATLSDYIIQVSRK